MSLEMEKALERQINLVFRLNVSLQNSCWSPILPSMTVCSHRDFMGCSYDEWSHQIGLACFLIPDVFWDLHGVQAPYANLVPSVSWCCGEAGWPNLLRRPLYAHGFLSYSIFLMNTRVFDLKIIKFGVDISHQKSEIKA